MGCMHIEHWCHSFYRLGLEDRLQIHHIDVVKGKTRQRHQWDFNRKAFFSQTSLVVYYHIIVILHIMKSLWRMYYDLHLRTRGPSEPERLLLSFGQQSSIPVFWRCHLPGTRDSRVTNQTQLSFACNVCQRNLQFDKGWQLCYRPTPTVHMNVDKIDIWMDVISRNIIWRPKWSFEPPYHF